MPNPKIVLWDLEFTNLNADFGHLLSGAFKVLGTKNVVCRSISDTSTFKGNPTDDAILAAKLRDDLTDADMWVTWYGERCDIPYLNSRLIVNGLQPMARVAHVDLWRTCRNKLRLHSNRLASASAFLGLEEKTPLKPGVWQRAIGGHKPSIRYIEEHNKQDVIVLEQAYNRLRPLVTAHPNVNIMSGEDGVRCPICGSGNLQKKGYRIAVTQKYQRFVCNACGAWSQGKPVNMKIEVR